MRSPVVGGETQTVRNEAVLAEAGEHALADVLGKRPANCGDASTAYRGDRPAIDVHGRAVILVDDGCHRFDDARGRGSGTATGTRRASSSPYRWGSDGLPRLARVADEVVSSGRRCISQPSARPIATSTQVGRRRRCRPHPGRAVMTQRGAQRRLGRGAAFHPVGWLPTQQSSPGSQPSRAFSPSSSAPGRSAACRRTSRTTPVISGISARHSSSSTVSATSRSSAVRSSPSMSSDVGGRHAADRGLPRPPCPRCARSPTSARGRSRRSRARRTCRPRPCGTS